MPLSLYNRPRLTAYLYHQAVQPLGSTALSGHDLREGFYGNAIKVPTSCSPWKATAYQIYEFFAQLIFKNNSYFVIKGFDTKVLDIRP